MAQGLSRRGLKMGLALCAPLLLSSIALSHPHRWHWRRSYYQPYYGQVATAGALTRADAARLRPGQFIWATSPGRVLPVSILIDLDRQVAFVYQGERLAGITTVSTGRRGYSTPTGTYPILEKAVWHRSTLYSGAPMPYMERLTWGGVALHAGGVPGYRQSHGCIHLPYAFARSLYGITSIGAIVEMTHGMPGTSAPMMMASVAMPTTAQAAAAMTATLL